jgi:hypothetical protein
VQGAGPPPPLPPRARPGSRRSCTVYAEASARCLARRGFALEGRLRDAAFKDGSLVDSLVFGLTRRDWEARPEHARGAAAGRDGGGAAGAAGEAQDTGQGGLATAGGQR